MTCANCIPSCSEIAQLQQKISQLEQRLNQVGKDDPNFAKKVFEALKGNKSGLAAIVGGLLIGGVRLSDSGAAIALPELKKATNTAKQLAPYVDDIPKTINLPKAVESLKVDIREKVKGLDLKLAKDYAKKSTVDSLSGQLGKVKKTADSALSVGTKAGKAAATATSTATRATTTAAAAGATASSALGKITTFLSAIGVIGGVAGLISLFGYFKAVRPQFNANEKRLDATDKALSKNLSLITQNRRIAQRAAADAADAQQTAAAAQKTAAKADRAAGLAQNTADAAKNKADVALKQSAAATTTANTALKEVRELEFPDVKVLKRQNDTAIQQNSRIIRLVENLPTNPNTEFKLPPELLALPPAIASVKRDTTTIAKNTTPDAQKANSKAGTCQAFAPSQCGDKAISRNTRPIVKAIDKLTDKFGVLNSFMINTLDKNLTQSIRKIDKLTTALNKKFDQTWKFLKMDRVLNLISVAASLHNAAMLSRNMIESLVFAVDGIFAMVGLKDAEGNPFSFSSQIAGGIRAIINRTIGAEAAAGISSRWNSWNRIISAGAAVVMSVRSVQWAIAEGVEIIGDWVAKIGNGLRESGTVNDYQWPWMKEGIKIKQFSAVERFNEGLESAETITNQIYATVAAGAEIGEAVNSVRASKQQFDQTLETEKTAADDQFAQDVAESEAPEIEPIDLVKLEEVEE